MFQGVVKRSIDRIPNQTPERRRMLHSPFILAGVLLSSCISEPASSPAAPPIYMLAPQNFVDFRRTGSTDTIPIAEDQLLITFRESASEAGRNRIEGWLRGRGTPRVGHAPGAEIWQYRLRHGDNLNSILDYLQAQPEIDAAFPNQAVFRMMDPNPNYPRNAFTGLWWVDAIGLRSAWDTTIGSPDISVAIVDDGVALGSGHFRGKTIRLGASCLHSNGSTYYLPIPASNTECVPYAPQAHGTAVASILTSRGDDGIGLAGVAWENPLISIDYQWQSGRYGVPTTSSFAVSGAILLAIRMGARVINASIGVCDNGSNPCTLERTTGWRVGLINVMREARRRNVLVVFAAGNDGFKNDDRWLPSTRPSSDSDAFISNSIIVGGVDNWNNPACTLDYDGAIGLCDVQRNLMACQCPDCLGSPGRPLSVEGRVVEISAPAYRITVPDTSRTDGALITYDSMGNIFVGTSFSAPMVAGAAALVWGLHPTWTAQQVKQRLLDTARRAGCRVIGHGILDVAAAVGTSTRLDAGVPDARTDAAVDARGDAVDVTDASPAQPRSRTYPEYGGFGNVIRSRSGGYLLSGGNYNGSNSRLLRMSNTGEITWRGPTDPTFAQFVELSSGEIFGIASGLGTHVMRLSAAGDVLLAPLRIDQMQLAGSLGLMVQKPDGTILVATSGNEIGRLDSNGTVLSRTSIQPNVDRFIMEHPEYGRYVPSSYLGRNGGVTREGDFVSMWILDPNSSVFTRANQNGLLQMNYLREPFISAFSPVTHGNNIIAISGLVSVSTPNEILEWGTDGRPVWRRSFDFPECLPRALLMVGSDLFVAGGYIAPGGTYAQEQVCLMKLRSSNGEVVSRRIFTAGGMAAGIIEAGPSEFLIHGQTLRAQAFTLFVPRE